MTTRTERDRRRRRTYERQQSNRLRKTYPFICWERTTEREFWRRHLCDTHGEAERKRDEIERDGGVAVVTRWLL